LSIGSCFNLCYLDKLEKNHISKKKLSRGLLKEIIANSVVISYLKKHGYSIVSFETGNFQTDLENAEFYIRSKFLINPFLNALKNITPIPDIVFREKAADVFDRHRGNIISVFDNLINVAQLNRKPKFVFAHIMSPHPPFIFGPNGESVTLEKRYSKHDCQDLIRPGRLTLAEYQNGYRNQVLFINKKIKKTVDDILSNSRRPPIILILGDHGPRSEAVWNDPERTNMKECLANLSAYYLPGGGDKDLYPEITPVNIFAVIFNYYFGEKLDLLADRSYFYTLKSSYKFYDVTMQVQRGAEKD
jgi:hypothetical protein